MRIHRLGSVRLLRIVRNNLPLPIAIVGGIAAVSERVGSGLETMGHENVSGIEADTALGRQIR